jgi:hypothetical protein
MRQPVCTGCIEWHGDPKTRNSAFEAVVVLLSLIVMPPFDSGEHPTASGEGLELMLRLSFLATWSRIYAVRSTRIDPYSSKKETSVRGATHPARAPAACHSTKETCVHPR